MTAPWWLSSTSTVTSSIGSCFSPSTSWNTTRGLLTASSIAFAAHVLEQDRQVQFAAAGDLEDAVFVGFLHTQRDVALQLAFAGGPQIWRLVTNLPSRPASGELLTQKFIVSVGSSIVQHRQRRAGSRCRSA